MRTGMNPSLAVAPAAELWKAVDVVVACDDCQHHHCSRECLGYEALNTHQTEQPTNPTSHAAVKLKYFTLATETPANESNNLAMPTTRMNPSMGLRNRTYCETLLPKMVMIQLLLLGIFRRW